MSRELLYDKIEATICEEDAELTADQARELLGWVTPEEGKKFDPNDVHLKDLHGVPVHCANITEFQRKYYLQSVKDLMWDILAKNWEQNGDTITIGKTGFVLDGKHRLTALVLAVQEWNRNPERYPQWPEEPTIPTILIFGIKEESKVVNTIGIGKPRSLADSIFSSGLFEGMSRGEMAKASKILEHAVRLLWDRTGAKEDSYSPKISHPDALDFVDRHPTLLQCVRTVMSENEDGSLSKILSPGYLAGLMYLMATHRNDVANYTGSTLPSEALLGELQGYEDADQFILALKSKDKRLKVLFDAFKSLDMEERLTTKVRMILIIQAWNAFIEEGPLEASHLELEYETYDGKKILINDPITGGLDQGFGDE